MIPHFRKSYNQAFTTEKYSAFLKDLHAKYAGAIGFRIAETPVFVPADFRDQMISACESMVDLITGPAFKRQSQSAIPARDFVPGDESRCSLIAFDFGVCMNERGELEPQLVEMQGFPSLYAFQVYYADILGKHFSLPAQGSPFLGGYTRETYLQAFKKLILGHSGPEHVILLEIKPHTQKTRIDFYCTREYTGIQPVCISELIPEGNRLYYVNEQTKKKTRVERIYNRIIFDELRARTDIPGAAAFMQQPWEVEWITHPNWFYRVSKHSLPFIRHPNVPKTYFLDEIKQLPPDLEHYVLKPLFSFAGQGVIIDLEKQDLVSVPDPQNWILQRKVDYAPVIQTPGTPARAEIRIMYLWPEEAGRPGPAINLVRLSKGKMIGVRYNANEEWVGGSVGLFGEW